MLRKNEDRRWLAGALAVFICALELAAAGGGSATDASSAAEAKEAAPAAAVCPIVYPVDQTASERGYRYLFYGDGFFINEQGYLVTAAHVLSQFRRGQPYVLLERRSGPPQFVRASLVAMDVDHDVAVLRATPNPFEGGYNVGYVPLVPAWPKQGEAISIAWRRPTEPQHAYTADAILDERTAGEVQDLQFSQLYKGYGETEVFLLRPQVRRGQSGAPVLSEAAQGVVGIVEGQWLRSTVVQLAGAEESDAPGVGAAVPVHYVIALLQQKGIAWHSAAAVANAVRGPASAAQKYSPPAALSLVACPFPAQALFGSEVVLDALIDTRGTLAETRPVRGEAPFLENALEAVRTWSFSPARLQGQPVAGRVGIVFQFVQWHEPLRAAGAGASEEPQEARIVDLAERGALPVVMVKPRLTETDSRDGSAILSGEVGGDGRLSEVRVVQDSGSLGVAAREAIEKWKFVPGRRGGADSRSAVIIVVVYR